MLQNFVLRSWFHGFGRCTGATVPQNDPEPAEVDGPQASLRIPSLTLGIAGGLLFCIITPLLAHASVPLAPKQQQISLPLIFNQRMRPVIANGDFEETPNSAWVEASSNSASLIVNFSLLPNSVQTHSGLYLAWLGGIPDEVSVLAQAVPIPPGDEALKLRYWYWIASEEANCTDDLIFVQVRDAETAAETTLSGHALCRTNATSGWTKACVDVAGWGGRTAIFQFAAVLDGSRNSNFFLDDVSLASTCVGG